jgi:hypothetical protein
VGEGISVSQRREHLFSPRAFTSLKVNQAIVKAFDGLRVLEPWVVYLKPMHEDPELSWFETTGAALTEAEMPGRRWQPSRLARLRRGVAKRITSWRSRWNRRRPEVQPTRATPGSGP